MNEKIRTYDYDAVNYIKTDEEWISYLNRCIELDEGDGRLIRLALGDMARAKGLTKVARKAGMTRQGLKKALSEEGNPYFDTIMKVIRALGLKLTVVPA